MSQKICITGSGVVSAIGIGRQETLASLQAGRSGIAPVRYLQTGDGGFLLGEVKATDAELKARLGLASDAVISRTSLLGILALQEALSEAGLSVNVIV